MPIIYVIYISIGFLYSTSQIPACSFPSQGQTHFHKVFPAQSCLLFTSPFVKDGSLESNKATAPDTIGVDIEVPLFAIYPFLPERNPWRFAWQE